MNYNTCNLLSLAQKFCLVHSTERWRIFQIPLQGWLVTCPRNATLFSSDISVWPDWPTMCLSFCHFKLGRNSSMGALAFWEMGEGREPGGELPYYFSQGWLWILIPFLPTSRKMLCAEWPLPGSLRKVVRQAGGTTKWCTLFLDQLPFLLILPSLNWPNKMLL